jgi:hypothetical protein
MQAPSNALRPVTQLQRSRIDLLCLRLSIFYVNRSCLSPCHREATDWGITKSGSVGVRLARSSFPTMRSAVTAVRARKWA